MTKTSTAQQLPPAYSSFLLTPTFPTHNCWLPVQLQDPTGSMLSPAQVNEQRRLLAQHGLALPELANGTTMPAYSLPVEAGADPRAAMQRRPSQRSERPYWTQEEIDQNLRVTHPETQRAPELMREIDTNINKSEQVLNLALNGGSHKDLVEALGGSKTPYAEGFARRISALAAALKSGDPAKIKDAALRANWAMVHYMAPNDLEKRRELKALFRQQHGISHPDDNGKSSGPRQYHGGGAFGNQVNDHTPGAIDPKDGQFRATSPSEVGSKALDAARSQIGVREASGNNDGLPSQRFANGRREPWCADFVTWSMRQADPAAARRYGSPSVQVMEDKMQAAGRWHRRSGYTPQPGDVIFFANRGASDRGSGRHVGIVEKVENGRVYTIEGNTSNAVRRRSYDLDTGRISGYGHP